MPEKSAYNCSQLTAHSSPRIVSLDTAKGLAIILVVIGHELQHRYGTDGLAFRLIYSFHMPMFMFLSGMVFSLKLKNFPSQSLNPSREIIKSSRGLLLPFVCWTLISCLTDHRDNITQYILGVIESPDRSLWFLLVLFWCRIFFVMIHSLCKKPSAVSLAVVMAVLYVAINVATKIFLPDGLMGAALFRAHFPYYALGVFMWHYRVRLSGLLDSIPANASMIVMFVIIAPCWYLVSPNPFTARHGEFLFKIITRVSPIPGIFLMMLLTKLILRAKLKHIISALSFTGSMTLGIYALHGRFLGYSPPVILPLLASIVLTVIIGRIPVLRVLLLGK